MEQADLVELALGATETTETNLGTITIPSTGVRRIKALWGVIVAQAATTAEGTAGYFRLAFRTVPGVFKFPAQILLGPAGTLASAASMITPRFIPVDIPVPANETVTVYVATFLAQTGTCRAAVGVIME